LWNESHQIKNKKGNFSMSAKKTLVAGARGASAIIQWLFRSETDTVKRRGYQGT
jgi:hypothetical protein